jgi:L-fucose mutarotase
MMAPVTGDQADPSVHNQYRAAIDKHHPGTPLIAFVQRFDFYERARQAFVIVATGDTRKYANILLKKGVTPIA